ncbi:MAG: hypothetical protein HQL48_08820, partial [Gammaproteobacteria bacterium]|nr:hypothetical protein [Gammaproteobacteria bacterium]
MNKMMQLLTFLMSLFLLISCGDFYQDRDGAAVTLVIGDTQQKQRASSAHNHDHKRESRSYHKAISAAYPGLSKVTLTFTGTGITAAGYTAEVINSQFNSGAFEVDSALNAFVLSDTVVNIKVPKVAPLTFTIAAYVESGGKDVQFFKGETTLQSETINAIERGESEIVPITLKNDIDPTLLKTVNDGTTPCSDSDGDTLCDSYEDLFKNESGVADIDGDTIVNSLDNDADGDG